MSQLLYGISHLWFLLALMMIFTIAHLSRRYWMGLSIKGMLGLIALFFMISPLVSKSGIALLALPATAYYLPAFFSGIFCSKYIDKLKELVVKNRKLIKISTFALVSAQLFICFSLIPSSIQSQLTKLFSLLIIASLWMLCFDKKWNTPSAIHSLDVNSMGIYIIHHILLIF